MWRLLSAAATSYLVAPHPRQASRQDAAGQLAQGLRVELADTAAPPAMMTLVGAPFVTILFSELVGTSSLFERQGDEAADAMRREHFGALRRALTEHEGREVKSTGDGLMVAFSSAVGAVRCAVDMQRAISEGPGSPGLRIGLDAGEPLPDDEDLYGTPVIVAGRLCGAAGAGEILASEVVCKVAGRRVAELIEPPGALRLAGLGERVMAAQVRWRPERSGDVREPGPLASHEVTVVVADDQDLLRAGFRVILDAEPDMRVVGEAPDGRTAVDVVTRRTPDVVLMDIRMPGLDGLQAAERILSEPDLETAVVMLTTFDLDEYIFDALRIGAGAFLLKDTPADRLLDAVRAAAKATPYSPPRSPAV